MAQSLMVGNPCPMARRRALMLVALQCASAFVAPQRSHLAPPRRRVAVAADNRVEDQLALSGDVAVLFLYSYMQKVIDSLYTLASMVSDDVATDEMDFFRDPSFAAAVLSAAWLAGVSTQGGHTFAATRSGVPNALATVAKGGVLALALVIAGLAARSAALGLDVCPQDVGFAAGLLPVVGSWRYVLAEQTDLP